MQCRLGLAIGAVAAKPIIFTAPSWSFRQFSSNSSSNSSFRSRDNFTRRGDVLSPPPTLPTFPQLSRSASSNSSLYTRNSWRRRTIILLGLSAGLAVSYYTFDPVRHSLLAIQRCGVIGIAVVAGVIDYKYTLSRKWENEKAMYDGYSRCHKRSAQRVLKALQTNGGIYIKLGQHISAVRLLPLEWTSTMRPLQDQCYPTPYEDVQDMFLEDTGKSIADLFSSFDPNPVGVASLAQVHVAVDKATGRKVAVKIQHPHLDEFAAIDMKAVTVSMTWVKALFPDFEFSWLADEMQENLPLEMDFRHEAWNANRAKADFRNMRHTTLYIPDVLWANKRSMVMEFIEGARVDDLHFLAKHNIDRNRVSQELSRIFSQMVYINGFFHADPHPGNLLIRPAQPHSRSPYNFEIVLLDHGLYFDMDDDLRVNYARLWLTLIAPDSKQTRADRRKYAMIVGNIGPDMYSLFESIITGRAGLTGTWETESGDHSASSTSASRAGSVMDLLPQSEDEMEHMRKALIHREGLIASVFDLLRRVPRRILMVLKLNDLTRSLDQALCTTHGETRIFIIVARYCGLAVWQQELTSFRERWRTGRFGTRIRSIPDLIGQWFKYQSVWNGLWIAEIGMDARAGWVQMVAWLSNISNGLDSANQAAAGLT